VPTLTMPGIESAYDALAEAIDRAAQPGMTTSRP
jgi:hypothetical protein